MAEDFPGAFLLVGLLHRALQFAVAEHLVSVDVDFVDFYFLVFIDHDVDNHFVFLAEVFLLHDLAGCFLEALCCVVFLNDSFDSVSDVRRYLAADEFAEPLFYVLDFAFFHSLVVHRRDAWLRREAEHEPSLAARDFFHADLHL